MLSYYMVCAIAYVVIPILILNSIQLNDLSGNITYESTNVVKGISIAVIVFHHISQTFQSPGILRPFLDFGYLGVSLFLFLSGYGLTCSLIKRNKLTNFIKGRLFKVYIPFVVLSSAYVLTNVVTGEHYDVWDSFVSLLGIKIINESYWFVYFILFSYAVYYFSFSKFSGLHACYAVTFFILIYWFFCFSLDFGKWWYTTSFCFPVGILFAIRKKEVIAFLKYRMLMIFTLTLVMLLSSILVAVSFDSFFSCLGKTISSVLFVVIVFLILLLFSFKSNVFSRLGFFSYEIYLVHVFALSFIHNLKSLSQLIVFFVIVFVGCVTLSKTSKIISQVNKLY